jgi:hypothetical protein
MQRSDLIGPYDPCPCGSGKKHKFCCRGESGGRNGPIGTVIYYGPDDKTIAKVAAGVVKSRGAEPVMLRFFGPNVFHDPEVAEKIKDFFLSHGVQRVVVQEGVFGCPHEAGVDFPEGEDCPFCPFWKGKQGSQAQ